MIDHNAEKFIPLYKILGVRWFTNKDATIGIVAVETAPHEWKAYIGVAHRNGSEEKKRYIVAYGNPLNVLEATNFFTFLQASEYKSY